MTIINTQEELDNMTKKWELDIKMWNTYTFEEVYKHLYSKELEKEYA
jgi:hypothetical protein